MEVVLFDRLEHADLVNEWHRQRGEVFVPGDDLPELGVLVRNKDGFVAAGFLRRVERSTVAMIDTYITNPQMPPKIRDQALDEVTSALKHCAVATGLTELIGFSVDVHTLERSKRFGFQHLPSQSILLKL
jgi:hypothetical protein